MHSPLCYGASSASVHASRQKISHNYRSAVGQSGFVAGNTLLKGAAITSTATADKNSLKTASLRFEDLVNTQKTSSSSMGLSASFGFNLGGGNPAGATSSATSSPASSSSSTAAPGHDPGKGLYTASNNGCNH